MVSFQNLLSYLPKSRVRDSGCEDWDPCSPVVQTPWRLPPPQIYSGLPLGAPFPMKSRNITPSPGSGSTASGLTVALGEGLGANPPEAKVGGLAGGIVVPIPGAQLSPVVGDHGHQGQHDAHQDAEEGHTYLQCVRLGHGGRWCAQGDSRCGRRGMELSLGAGRGWADWEQLPTPVRPQGGVSACAGLGFQGCSPLQPEIPQGAQSPACSKAD